MDSLAENDMQTTTWKAIAQYNLTPESYKQFEAVENVNFLQLYIGEQVTVLYSSEDWCYGRKVVNDDETLDGVFPMVAVNALEAKRSTILTKEADEIVVELNETLEEWWSTIKKMYGEHNLINYQEDILQFMEDIMVVRKKVLFGNVPLEELKEMRIQIARKIDIGNHWLNLDLVARDETSRQISTESVSVIQLYRNYVIAAERVQKDSKPDSSRMVDSFSLLVHVQSATLECKSECEFSLSLYDSVEQKFLSESFIFYWSPQSRTLTNRNTKALFNDLSWREYSNAFDVSKNNRILMCIRVARIAPIEPSSSTMKKVFDAGPPQFWSRQPCATAVIGLSEVFNESSRAVEHITALNMEDSVEQLITKATNPRFSNSGKVSCETATNSIYDRSQLLLSAQILIGSLQEIKKSNPQIFSLSPPIELRKMEFTDILSSDESRNDLYFSLMYADLHGGKGSDKNIEARISIFDSKGTIYDNINIITADGVLRRTTYHSLVFYHDDKPKWNETIKIEIPDEEIQQNLHVRIAFYYKKVYDKGKQEKSPFAIAFARIMEGSSLIKDDTHELLIYKVEAGKFVASDVSYIRLPATREELKLSQSTSRPQTPTFIQCEKNHVIVQTATCSTSLTHNKTLLDILQWKVNRNTLRTRLEEILVTRGVTVGKELVKFIPNFCDVLFEILDQCHDYDELVFDSLVFVIQLVNEERYKSFRNVLEKYIENFHSTIAFVKLMPLLRNRIESAEKTHELTLSTLKSFGSLMKIIVKSKQCSDRLDVTNVDFVRLMIDFFNSLIAFFKNREVRVTCHNTALKFLPTIFPHISQPGFYNRLNLKVFLIDILNNLNHNVSMRYRLNFMREIVLSDFFVECSSRNELLPKILDKVVEELDEISCKTINLDLQKMDDHVGIYAEILFDIHERLFGKSDESNGTEEEFHLVFSKVFRSITLTTVHLIMEKRPTAAFGVLIAALLNRISPYVYKRYFDVLVTRIDKLDFLMESLHIFTDFIEKPIFPSPWFSMFYLLDKVMIKIFNFVISTVLEHFQGEQFDPNLWRQFTLTLVTFITQKHLQHGSSVSAKRKYYLSSQPDLRYNAVGHLRSLWFCLTMKDKGYFIPSMIGPFLQVALTEDTVVRETVIPIFFNMMQCEFNTHPFRNLSRFANEMIIQLDCLVDDDSGDACFKEQFKQIMMQMCCSDSDLKTEGCRLINTLDTLLQHLFEYREVRANAHCIENGMDRTVQLLKYYETIGQHDLYVNYVYKLYDLHMLSSNKVEAAYTLLKHAETLTWEDRQLPMALIDAHLNRHCGTHRHLKEALYKEAANLFDEKEMWEDAISILKSIALEYEKHYEYGSLAQLLHRMADLYHKISSQSRVGFTFYLVGFYGAKFPHYLNGQKYVHRGDECEAIASFQHRMLSTFLETELVTSMDDCSHLSQEPGRFLQIFPVRAYSDMSFEKKSTNGLVYWYWKNNKVQNFEYCKGQLRKDTKWTKLEDNEIMRSWVIRRFVKSSELLPNILKWSSVSYISEPVEYSPLMEAVRVMQKNNDELEEMAHIVLCTPLESVVPLGGKIRGIVQAFVQGGIKNYRVFFTDQCSSIMDEHEIELVRQLEELIKKQVCVLEFSLYVHASRKHQVDLNFHQSLVESFIDYKADIEEKFGKIASQLLPGCSINISSLQKSNEDRKSGSLDATIAPTVMNLVFRRSGGFYNSKTVRAQKKTVGSRSDLKSACETSVGVKRVSSSSDHSMDSMFNDCSNNTPRSTVDLSQCEHSARSLISSSIAEEYDNDNRSVSNVARSIEILPAVAPPLPPRLSTTNRDILPQDSNYCVANRIIKQSNFVPSAL